MNPEMTDDWDEEKKQSDLREITAISRNNKDKIRQS